MSQLLEVAHYIRSLQIHPLGLVIVAALLAALIEQRMARRRTPDFSAAYRDIDGPPQAPPPTLPRDRR